MRMWWWVLVVACTTDPAGPLLPPPTQLEVGPAVPGQDVLVTLTGIANGVHLTAGIAGSLSGACAVPLGGQCSALGTPFLRRSTVSANGEATIAIPLPAIVPVGTPLYVQVGGSAGPVQRLSQVFVLTAEAEAPTCAEVQGSLQTHCNACHGVAALGDLDIRDVATLVDAPSTGAPMPLITAGDADASYLVHKLEGTHLSVQGSGIAMPPGGPLDAGVLSDIRQWIDAGATCPPAPVEPLRPAPAGLRTLTPQQYAASLRLVLDLDPANDAPVPAIGAWATSAGAALGVVPETTAIDYEATAHDLAAWAFDPVRRLDTAGCEPLVQPDDPCITDVIATLGRRAYRRPLATDELQRWTALATDVALTENDAWFGLQLAVSGLLQAPNFLYRVELTEPDPTAPPSDPDRRRYSDYELATRLSYLLFGEPPDDLLLDAVAAGELSNPTGFGIHVDRMLADSRAEQGMDIFLHELLEVDALTDLDKDELLFPDFASQRDAMGEQMVWTSTRAVLAHGFGGLFTADEGYVDASTAPLFGLDPTTLSGTELVAFPPERRGVLTQPGFLSMHAYPGKTSPALRGLYVRRTLLCFDIPPPPPSVVTVLPEQDPNTLVTTRELVQVHQQEPSCAACHGFMDPIGLGLEQFDAVGAHRLTENGLTIDASGDLDGIPFTDAVSLGAAISTHPDLLPCMTANLLAYADGITAPSDHPDVLALMEPSGDARAALGTLARSALFRNAWEDAP